MKSERPLSRGLERRLGVQIQVLDHGFVRVVDYMGNDDAIVQAARVSYGSGTKTVKDDTALIRYLMRHRHTTPFEMCEIKLHVKMPIFVARQWIRHRTANVNEYSARYSILDREFYIPEPEHLASQSVANKQGRGSVLEGDEMEQALDTLQRCSDEAFNSYEDLLSTHGKEGLSRELARMVLPTSVYTQWYWKIDLHNLLHFLLLRTDPHAQYEIRAYADVIANMVQDWVPVAFQAFEDYQRQAVTMSRQEMECIRDMVKYEYVGPAESGMSDREWEEFFKKIAPHGVEN